MSQSVNSAAVYAALSKAAEKAFEREALAEGTQHTVQASVTGTVDGEAFSLEIDTTVKVGHGSVRSSSIPVSPIHLTAYILELVELAFADSADPEAGQAIVADIVHDVQAKFLAEGSIPATDRFVAIAEILDKSLRQSKPVAYRGSVSVTTAAPAITFR